MKTLKVLLAALTLGTLTLGARADVTNVLTFTVVGAVQQPATSVTNTAAGTTNHTAIFTNVVLNTSALLKQIAVDQSLTLPSGAQLGLINGQLYVLNKNDSIFAPITVMTFSTGAAIGRFNSTQTKKNETSKSQTLQVVTFSYSGATLTFSLNILAVNTATSGDNYVSGKQSNTFVGGYGFGYGTYGGAPMIAKGFLGGGGTGTYVVP